MPGRVAWPLSLSRRTPSRRTSPERGHERLDLGHQRPTLPQAGHRPGGALGDLVVGRAVELAPEAALADAAPLLEEELDPGGPATVAEAPDPARVHRPGPGPALAADDGPAD